MDGFKKAARCLGGMAAITAQVTGEDDEVENGIPHPSIKFYLRPEDAHCHPLLGERVVHSKRIALRVTSRVNEVSSTGGDRHLNEYDVKVSVNASVSRVVLTLIELSNFLLCKLNGSILCYFDTGCWFNQEYI